MALVFYYKDRLEKVTMQRTQQFSAFVQLLENIETDFFSRNVPISDDPVVRI